MARWLCPCGRTLSDSAFPNPAGLYVLTEQQYDARADAADFDLILEATGAMRCPGCARLWVWWDGWSDTPTIYQPEVLDRQGYTVHWTAHLRAGRPNAAQKLVDRMAQLTDADLHVQSCERYWKDDALYVVRFTSSLAALSDDGAICDALRTAGAIGGPWSVIGPGGPVQLVEAMLSTTGGRFHLSGVEWISFLLVRDEPAG